MANTVIIDGDGARQVIPTIPAVTAGGGLPVALPSGVATTTSATTSATGATYVAFPAAACSSLSIANGSGVDIEFRRSGAGAAVPVFDGAYYLVLGIANASDVSIRRRDQSNVQVVVAAEAVI